jgi:hypothetical protein
LGMWTVLLGVWTVLLGVWTVLLGLVATAFAVGVVMVLNKQMATDEANRRAGIADVPPFAILALLVGIVGLIFLGLFIENCQL